MEKINIHSIEKKLIKGLRFTIVGIAATVAVFLSSVSVYALAITLKGDIDVQPPTELSEGKDDLESLHKDLGMEVVAVDVENGEANEADNEEPITDETEPEPLEDEPVIVSPAQYSEDDVYYLAAAVCHEAGSQPEEIQLLVANVIINRVNSDIFPDTIYEVLTQHMQYGTMWKYGVSFPSWATAEIKERCYSVAGKILNGERYCPENVLFQAEFKQGSGVFKHFDEGYYFCYYGS